MRSFFIFIAMAFCVLSGCSKDKEPVAEAEKVPYEAKETCIHIRSNSKRSYNDEGPELLHVLCKTTVLRDKRQASFCYAERYGRRSFSVSCEQFDTINAMGDK